ncbi:MAG: MmcQ/YjbR family DNA-binding protein [Ignavibacteriaceae bacterium]|nr:MmcQ/YjbR family DNA-binding protein [Ignavibacteriaceae bacterium]
MFPDEIRIYCLKKPGTSESFPFDEVSPVYKVVDKIFCIVSIEPPLSVNLKCDPERAVDLRERYSAITPGWHMNKTHWNTVYLQQGLPDSLVRELIDHSYNLIVSKLKKSDREHLKK